MKNIIDEAKKDIKRKKRIKKLMIGRIEELMKETKKILNEFLLKNRLGVVVENVDDANVSSTPKGQEEPIQDKSNLVVDNLVGGEIGKEDGIRFTVEEILNPLD
jgi:hypothetical protein